MGFKTMIYRVVYRQSPEEPQQEAKRYTKEAADAFAWSVYVTGGVAVVVEDMEEQRGDPKNGIDFD